MKNRLTSLLLLPISVGMLAGCHLEVFRESANEGRDVLTKQLVEDNVNKQPITSKGRTLFENITIDLPASPTTVESLNTGYRNTFFKISFADGDFTIFSTIANKILIEKGKYNLCVSDDETVLVVSQTDAEGKQTFYRVIDQYGNVIDDNPSHSYSYASSSYPETLTDKDYCLYYAYTDNATYKNHIYFVTYNEDCSIKNKSIDIYNDKNLSNHVGDQLTSSMAGPFDLTDDLARYGLKGYYANKIKEGSSPYTIKKIQIYNSQGELNSTYSLPYYDSAYWLDRTILCQVSNEVPYDSEDYTYEDSLGKYKLSSWKVDILTGEITYVDFNYLIKTSVESLFDSYGTIVYKTLSLQEISNYKLQESKKFIVDKEFELHNNVSDILVSSLTKHGDNYYYMDYYEGMVYVYNYKLDLLAKFKGFAISNTELYAYKNEETGLYSVLSNDLKVLTNSVYSEILDGCSNYNQFYGSYYNEGSQFDALFTYEGSSGNISTIFCYENPSSFTSYHVLDELVCVQQTPTSELEFRSLFDGSKVEGFINVGDASLYTILHMPGSHNDDQYHKVCGDISTFYVENSTGKLNFFTDAIYGLPSYLS